MSCYSLSKVLQVRLRRESTTNSKNNTFELSGDDASAKEVTYKHFDGVITVDISGTEHEYYKEGTDAYKEAVNKYNELQN